MSRLVALTVSALLIMVGPALAGCSRTQPEPAPFVPFGAFEVGEGGGVAGRQDTLAVRADGVALRISTMPAAGRLSQPVMDRLRTLLESEDFRREVSAALEGGPPTCTDMFNTSVRMGSLAMTVDEPCGNEKQPATPAFDEILALTAAARQGQFDGPVGAEEPRLVGLRLQRLRTADQAAYTINVAADGEATLTREGTTRRRVTLPTADQDTLRLLVDRLVGKPVVECRTTVHYRLTIRGFPRSSGPDCGYQDRSREFAALNGLLQKTFRV